MKSLYAHQDANVRKTWLLMSLFFILVIAVGWFVSYWYNTPAILYIAVAVSIVMNVWSYWSSDKLVIALTRARPLTKEVAPEVWNIVENLSITAGLPMPKVYVIDDTAPNAFATGRNPEHGAVAVTTGLLQMLDRSELEGVIAHELAHIGNRDTLLATVVVVLVGLLSIIADVFLRSTFFGRDNQNGQAGAVLAIVGFVFILLAPLIGTVIRLAISRKREFLADASGALLTRYPDGLASALSKIASFRGPMRHKHHATAHLFISNPFGGAGKALGIIDRLFATHPPTEARIAALRGMQ